MSIIKENVYVYRAADPAAPAVWMNVFEGDGHEVREKLEELGAPDHTLVAVRPNDFDLDLSPWPAEAVFPGQPDFNGGAQAHLAELTEEVMPRVLASLPGQPAWNGLAGYSMGGLFTLWASTKTDTFARFASGSGSVWYPDFLEYFREAEFPRIPDCVYLSLGGKEAKTRHPLMSQVEVRTQAIKEDLAKRGVPVTFEKNPGNHFREPDLRMAKGIAWILRK